MKLITDNNSEYITLQEIAKYCHYSQEYLSLRARQGKLKAVKFGRNWVTKKEWLDEYLQKAEEYNNNFKVKKVSPPKNLPVEPSFPIGVFRPQLIIAIALAVVFIFAGLFFNKENFKIAIDNISSSSQLAEIGKGSGEILKDYFSWIGRSYKNANDFLEEKISQGYKAITQLWRVPEKVEEELTPKPTGEGLVVIPSTEKDEETVKKIKESFSDEVKVEIKDKTSGIIIPIFKKGEGEKYLYILVPISYEQ